LLYPQWWDLDLLGGLLGHRAATCELPILCNTATVQSSAWLLWGSEVTVLLAHAKATIDQTINQRLEEVEKEKPVY
jgi:hypothetical protein